MKVIERILEKWLKDVEMLDETQMEFYFRKRNRRCNFCTLLQPVHVFFNDVGFEAIFCGKMYQKSFGYS